MMSEEKLTISIDPKEDRIRIHRHTLYRLGSPNYILLLYNPEKKIIAIKGYSTGSSNKSMFKVNLTTLPSDCSYEIYSKRLVDRWITDIDDLRPNNTFRLEGDLVEDQRLAIFPMETLQYIEECGEE